MAERLTIGTSPRLLEAVLDLPATPCAGAVLCHPHPHYGGSMDNAVIVTVAGALAAVGVGVLRFNFGGVGRSRGRYSGGPEEAGDAAAAVAALAARLPDNVPVALIGYSFGAWVALAGASAIARAHRVIAIAPPLVFFDPATLTPRPQPVTIVVGDRDEFCPAERLAGIGAGVSVQLVRGADHFLAGHEEEVARVVVNSLGLRTPPENRG